jgi:PAS domain S-box-containing protein
LGQHIDDYETVRLRKDGTKINVSISLFAMYDGEGILVGASSIARDISERKRIDEQLRKMSRAVEQSPASIVITSTAGIIEYVNPKFIQITGYSLEDAIGKNARILKSGEKPPEEYKELWETITSGNEWHGEFHNKRKNGELYWESAVISPIKNDLGIVSRFLAIKEDITERKEAEAEREKLILELQEALADVKTLGGLIPICSSCKKIRDDKGYWNILEAYLMKHSDAKFTHGICPECMVKLYPDIVNNKSDK